MNRTAKFILGFCIVVGIVIIGVIGVLRLLAPNVIKTELSKQVYQLTGHSLTINGDIHWSFFPWLGIKVEGVVLNNRDQFGKTPLAKAGNIQLNVKLIPLLSHQLEVGNILINDFTLYLFKTPDGQNNWASLLASSLSQKHSSTEKNQSSRFDMFQAGIIQFKGGKVYFDDQQKHKHTELSDFNFTAKNIALDKAFPVNLSFGFKQRPSSFLYGNIRFNAALMIEQAKNQFNFSNSVFDADWKNAEGKQTVVRATGDVVYNAKNTHFAINQITAKLNDYSFTGNLAGILNPQFAAQGHLRSTALRVGFFLFQDVQTNIDMKNSIMALNSVTASLYGGHYTGDILIDTRPVKSVVTFNGMLKQANAGMLFTWVTGKNNEAFTGTIDVSSMLKFVLGTSDTIRKTLNGNITVRLQNGVLHGINIPALIDLGQAILKQKAMPTIANNQTDFGVIKGTFQIKDGIMFNEDLTLQSSQLNASGQGKIDLVNNQIDYRLVAGLIGRKMLVPILIRGSLSQPIIAPDMRQVVGATLNQQVNQLIEGIAKPGEADKLKEKVGKELNKLNLGGLLG